MKKLLFILPFFFFAIEIYAQQTEDEVHIGSYPKGKTFGNYKGNGIIIPDFDRPTKKPATGPTTISGIVTGIVAGLEDSLTGKGSGVYSFTLKKDDGTIITVGTKDFGFKIPKNLIGKQITVEGIDAISGRKRMTMQKENQENIQFAASGIKVL